MKTVRQLNTSISQPPSSGPAAPTAAPAAAQMPIARPRAGPENEVPRIARLFGSTNAAAIPCTALAVSSTGRFHAPAHSAEAAPKAAMPQMKTVLRPRRSPAAPPRSRSAPRGSR